MAVSALMAPSGLIITKSSVDLAACCVPVDYRHFPATFRPMRILSGLQPSGRLHLGNFFGMMEPALRLQHEGEAFYFIADYHSLTTVRDPKVLRENSLDLAIDFLACGLDPAKATFFRQSDVPEVTELSWPFLQGQDRPWAGSLAWAVRISSAHGRRYFAV